MRTWSRPHGTELSAFLHRDEHLAGAQQQLRAFLGPAFMNRPQRFDRTSIRAVVGLVHHVSSTTSHAVTGARVVAH
jgi:hypothetical protein